MPLKVKGAINNSQAYSRAPAGEWIYDIIMNESLPSWLKDGFAIGIGTTM